MIGAGIIGLSIAYHLASLGTGRIVVLERESIASGTTAKATGGLRHQFSQKVHVQLSKRSIDFYSTIEDRLGYPVPFNRVGYVFLVDDEAVMESLQQSVVMQNSLGVPTELVTPARLHSRYPTINVEGLVAATYCPLDGVGSPVDAAMAFANAARRLGVDIREGCAVTDVHVENSRISGVSTPMGRIDCDQLVVATGAWTSRFNQALAWEFPIEPHPRQVFVLTSVDGTRDLPFLVDVRSGTYVHAEANDVLLGGGDRDRGASYDAIVDWDRLASIAEAMTHRIPALKQARAVNAWCGLREMTPDDMPLLGPVPSVDGVWCAAGFSGHGFMHAPAAGEIVAGLITGSATVDFDVSGLRLDRFSSAHGSVGTETTVF